MRSQRPPRVTRTVALGAVLAALAIPALAFAQEQQTGEPYRFIAGLDSRQVIWIVGQLHLLFGAFVLGVPIFAVILEVVGMRTGDPRYDRLARECTQLLSAAFATTASLGGLMAFVLFGLYPGVMRHIAEAMHTTFYIYGAVFFIEVFTLYYYYYAWTRMQSTVALWPRIAKVLRIPAWVLGGVTVFAIFYLFLWNGQIAMDSFGVDPSDIARGAPTVRPLPWAYRYFPILAGVCLVIWGVYSFASGKKSFHVFFGVILNLAGIAIMTIANSWGTFMMSPTGIDPSNGAYVGDTWGAVSTYLWRPLSLHRLMGNIAFGGFIVGGYAAVRFLAARRQDERAYYDWMGYIGNFIGISGLLLIPFAGYYLGREIYSYSPVMGNDSMGGFLSWNFVVQAVLIGFLFIGANFYLWAGMERIEGAERYRPYVKYILAALVLSFLVWVIPHNLPLRPEEAAAMGTQYHPVLKYLGLMPAKNAAVNLILLSTYFSFMLYRRANKGEVGSMREAGLMRFVLPGVALLTVGLTSLWTWVIFKLDPGQLSLDQSVRPIFQFHAWMMMSHIVVQIAAVVMTFTRRGKLGQAILLGYTALVAVGIFGPSGFFVLASANPFLRHLAVCQVLLVLVSMVLATAIDVTLFRGAKTIGRIRWGEIGARPQYALVLLAVTIVLTLGLMGYIHSGVRQDWHFYMVVRDVSPKAQNPGLAEVGYIVALITVIYLSLVSFVFWLGTFGAKTETPDAVCALDENPSETGTGTGTDTEAGTEAGSGTGTGTGTASVSEPEREAPAAEDEAPAAEDPTPSTDGEDEPEGAR